MTSGDGIRTPTRAIRILGLVIESGMLYIIVGVSPPPPGTWVQARVITLFLFSRQVLVLVGPFMNPPYLSFTETLFPSTGQLAVRNHFQSYNLELY